MESKNVRGSIPDIIKNVAGVYEGDLQAYFRAVFKNAKNLNTPYHNFRHMCHVLWLCHDACVFYGNQIPKREARRLMIAALFHDFNHTGRPGPDNINIELAITGFRTHLQPGDLTPEDIYPIEWLIRCTEYPYRSPSENLELPAQIIRDADLSQALAPAWIQQVIFGLAQERGKEPSDVLKMQIPFHNKLNFATEWAKQLFPSAAIQAKIDETMDLLGILGLL